MNCSQKRYICGFNGFKQIVQCMSQTRTSHCDDSANSSHNSQEIKKVEEQTGENLESCKTKEKVTYFAVPQEVKTEIKLCTWSNVWGTTGDGKLNCYGYNSSSLMSELTNDGKDMQTSSVVALGKDVLIQDSSHTVFIQDEGRICELTADLDHVTLVAGTRDRVYGVKEGQIFEGNCKKQSEGQETMKLYLHPITNNLNVKTVSCGFEHTLMLTSQGAVYSYGSGSRGQLGHGEVTVDLQKTPRCVDTFTGIVVVAIATGGWHSAAVTDSGDVYVWGWNDSGQLGLPNGTVSTADHPSTDSHHAVMEDSSIVDCDSELRREDHCSDVKSRTVQVNVESDDASEAKYCDMQGYKRKFTDLDEGDTGKMHDFDKCAKNLVTTDFEKNAVCEEHCNFKRQQNLPETSLYSESRKHYTDCVSDFEAGDSNCVPIKYCQSVDCVQVQTVPYGLDFPKELHVESVSCGTRHTCILSDTGIMLTAGWNSYGQLCHGDIKSRDYFETVTYFTTRKEKVVDVKAQYWNTYIVTENN